MSTATASAAKPINYKEVYFNHARLRKVTSKPTYDNLQYLYKQVKSNADYVPITLGVARHGHIGIVMNVKMYA